MALVIRNGLLMTMTEQGSLRGDILISGGRILKVAGKLDDLEGFEHEELDAEGMTILPGLIDPYIRDGGAEPAWVAESALDAGVTTAVLLPETGQRCMLLGSGGLQSGVSLLQPEALSDQRLAERLQRDAAREEIQLCSIRSRKQLERVLECSQGQKGIVLTELNGCEGCAREIAASGFGAVLGVTRSASAGGSWRLAAELTAQGVPVAVSSFHPVSKLKLLPVCAGLCVREGMGREQALQAITSVPAALLGLTDRGRLQAGCRADLAIFDGDPLLLATSLVMTIADGRVHRSHGHG